MSNAQKHKINEENIKIIMKNLKKNGKDLIAVSKQTDIDKATLLYDLLHL